MKKLLNIIGALPLALLVGCPSNSDGHEGHDHDGHGHEAGEHPDGNHGEEPEEGHDGHDHDEGGSQ